jgi:hypothetical protein
MGWLRKRPREQRGICLSCGAPDVVLAPDGMFCAWCDRQRSAASTPIAGRIAVTGAAIKADGPCNNYNFPRSSFDVQVMPDPFEAVCPHCRETVKAVSWMREGSLVYVLSHSCPDGTIPIYLSVVHGVSDEEFEVFRQKLIGELGAS